MLSKLLLTFVAVVTLATTAGAADLAGYWRGTWIKVDDPLAVTVSFVKSEKGLVGSFDSDELQVAGIPFKEVTTTGDRVRFVLAGDATTIAFEGVLDGDKLSGSLTEGDVKGSFSLLRAKEPPSLVKREVTFQNGDVRLSGELLLPASDGRRPAIVFLHGSGPEGRWGARYLAGRFARAGFVALIYDKRGVGGSTGDWRASGFEDLANDAVAGVRLLQAEPSVDPKRIGVYGHSQGGTIAPLVVVRAQNLSFVIGSAASGVNPAEAEIYSIENSIGVPRLAGSEQADARSFVREIVDVAYNGKPRAELDVMIARFKDRSWFFNPPAPDNFYWAFSRRIAGYRPLEQWAKVRAPVLLAYGALDQRVPPQESAAAISATLKGAGNNKVAVSIFPNAGHAFHIEPQAREHGWGKRVREYADTLVNWAAAQK